MSYSVRISGGKYHQRKICFDSEAQLRPSASRVRTVLFDWLRPDIEGMRCLDLFAGSGILSFQALSWGAASSVCIDRNAQACALIKKQAVAIDAPIETQVKELPCIISGQYDLYFIDPPFAQRALLDKVIVMLKEQNILSPGALVYIEWCSKLDISEWSLKKYKQVSQVHMHLLEVL